MKPQRWFLNQAWWHTARTIYERRNVMSDSEKFVNLADYDRLMELATNAAVEALGDTPIDNGRLRIAFDLGDGAILQGQQVIAFEKASEQ